MKIPIIDIFAGPGGLGEGFSAYTSDGSSVFKIGLSIEKEAFAHKTLTLRSFFRQFSGGSVPAEYYDYLKGEIDEKTLFKKYPDQAKAAVAEAWQATLGEVKSKEVDDRITAVLRDTKNWVLIGGPPCQAYSLAGRSRMAKQREQHLDDEKHFLYKEYLRIIKKHKPAVFVMENVKGLLSAVVPKKEKETKMFDQIRRDLTAPGYRIYSLSTAPARFTSKGKPKYNSTSDFLIRSEEYGLPQARHRVILLGVRSDVKLDSVDILQKSANSVSVRQAISDLPRLRSKISKGDSFEDWRLILKSIANKRGIPKAIYPVVSGYLGELCVKNTGGGYVRSKRKQPVGSLYAWYWDEQIEGFCNHESRSHIEGDLLRYFFAACYAEKHGKSPTITDFPKNLYPDHKNVHKTSGDIAFADRFRVQVADKPSTTVVSHISKDGHYYIHYDPAQCRSLTVREAARLQTFPDNYFFEGERTSQYHQVGNAVPPYLACQIAKVVHSVLSKAGIVKNG